MEGEGGIEEEEMKGGGPVGDGRGFIPEGSETNTNPHY